MAKLFSSVFLCLFLLFGIIITTPSAAYAHGVGGIDATKSNAKVSKITPNLRGVNVETVENGQRLKISLKGAADAFVLGVDGELYIRISKNGVYINQLSPTRVINQSTSNVSLSNLDAQFKSTSNDPNTKPKWKKVSSNSFYIFHDHRAHYMGSVPKGTTNLGTSTLPLKVDGKVYDIEIVFFSKSSTSPFIPFTILFTAFLFIFVIAWTKRELCLRIFNKKVAIISLFIISLFETMHVIGYLSFSQRKFFNEVGGSFYSIALIILSFICLIKLLGSNKLWKECLHANAPLLSATGFIGIVAGCLIEYKNVIYPYPATIFSSGLTKVLIISIGIFSALIFATSVVNIKSVSSSQVPIE
ncbi:MAG: hypothetical protein U0R17_04060 [Acidimicrobiia bacterium]